MIKLFYQMQILLKNTIQKSQLLTFWQHITVCWVLLTWFPCMICYKGFPCCKIVIKAHFVPGTYNGSKVLWDAGTVSFRNLSIHTVRQNLSQRVIHVPCQTDYWPMLYYFHKQSYLIQVCHFQLLFFLWNRCFLWFFTFKRTRKCTHISRIAFHCH